MLVLLVAALVTALLPSPATTVLSDDFETQSGLWTTGAANCQGTGTVSLDGTVAHSGSHSMRVDGKAYYCNHAFFGTRLSVSTPLYVRFYLRHSTPLPTGHVTFLAMKDTNDGGRDLRMGGQNGALQFNRESDDATLPAQSPVGVAQSRPLPVGGWHCLEFGLDGGHLQTWLDSAVVPGLVEDGVPTPDIDQQWLARGSWRPVPVDLRFGWESYAGGDDALWFDDIAVATTRIGC